jgi:uncharacterized SAM-binding protein YcdF (DUF218 family)
MTRQSDFHIITAIIKPVARLFRQPLARFIAGFLCVTLMVFIAFRQLGIWLIAADPPPRRLDVICTFAGESRRVDYSKKLMLQHNGAHWLLSDYKDGHGRLLQKNNFDMRRVTIFDTCKNTRSEINAMHEWIVRYRHSGLTPGCDTATLDIGLVSSPYHMRRIKIMASRHIGNDHLRLHLLPVPLDEYQWSRDTFRYWWRSNYITSLSLLELVKIGYYLVTGYF